MVTGESVAYEYLPSSSEAFLSAEEMAANLVRAGFTKVDFHRVMFGTVAIHWAEKET
jgi:demethylmenaquinone methyltransferase/2-methoxy-6-polyprenyl-1,4-benzoquinol methylase